MITVEKPDGKKLKWNIEAKGLKHPSFTYILESETQINRFSCDYKGGKVLCQFPSDDLEPGQYKTRIEVRDGSYIQDIEQQNLVVIKADKIKEMKETTQAGAVVTGKGVEAHSQKPEFFDREPILPSVKYYSDEPKSKFMKRCIEVEIGKGLKPERSKALCEIMWNDFITETGPVSEYEAIKSELKKVTKEIMEADQYEFERMVDFLLELDVDELDDNQISELDKILSSFNETTDTSDVATKSASAEKPVSRLNSGLLRTHKTSSIHRAKQRKYDKLNRTKITKKRRQIAKKKSVSGKAKEKKKEIMAKSLRTRTGRDKKKYNTGGK